VKYSGLTLSFDGKTVRSTAKMKAYKNPLHIVNAQIANLGITLGQTAVESKSNEIPAVRELIFTIKPREIVAESNLELLISAKILI
jgi:hypothetical protein